MSKLKVYKKPEPPPDPEVVAAQEFAMTLPVEKYADMERDVVWGYENGKPEDIHIENELFTLDITKLEDCCDADVKLKVRGREANIDDFGNWADIDEKHAPEWGCGNMYFTIWLAEDAILKKYGINLAEYYIIGMVLEKYLWIGCCDQCG